MKIRYRIWAIILVLSIILPLGVNGIQAAETDNLQELDIHISNGEQTETYSILSDGSDLFFSEDTFGEITRYSYRKANTGEVVYDLGEKRIIIDSASKQMDINSELLASFLTCENKVIERNLNSGLRLPKQAWRGLAQKIVTVMSFDQSDISFRLSVFHKNWVLSKRS